jgi:hypothetical protein|tara:strand:+ start:1184 stop:1525 length:342 start_codon:yes stop_codon:yes gene_type:complete
MPDNWVPEIMYEESEDGVSSNIPFVMVPENEEMPKLIYIFESRDTGEFEPGLEGEEVPVVQWDLHQYADMDILKRNLDTVTYDIVRSALSLEPLSSAVKKGEEISSNIRENLK